MAHGRDFDAFCRKCGKKTRRVRCPRCKGKGRTATTTCHPCDNTGSKCQNGVNEQFHK